MIARRWPDWRFWLPVATVAGAYLALIVAMLVADAAWVPPGELLAALRSPEIAASIRLTLLSSTAAALLALGVALPTGYLLARAEFRGKALIDALIDIPTVLPPLVVGLSLLILFRVPLPFTGARLDDLLPATYAVGGVVLAQFVIGASVAVRTMRLAFEHLPRRPEEVARVLGCSRAQAVRLVTLPAARGAMVAAGTLAWARAMGEFGPILVFAGATRMRTEVMSTTVFLELSVGNLRPALAVALLMVLLALAVLVVVRWCGGGRGIAHDRA